MPIELNRNFMARTLNLVGYGIPGIRLVGLLLVINDGLLHTYLRNLPGVGQISSVCSYFGAKAPPNPSPFVAWLRDIRFLLSKSFPASISNGCFRLQWSWRRKVTCVCGLMEGQPFVHCDCLSDRRFFCHPLVVRRYTWCGRMDWTGTTDELKVYHTCRWDRWIERKVKPCLEKRVDTI